jgi:hypothetical protein
VCGRIFSSAAEFFGRSGRKHLSGVGNTGEDWSKYEKVLYFSIVVVAFFGSFRISEILALSNKHFDKFSTLLWKDVKFKSKKVIVKIISPKVLKSWNEVYLFKFKINTFVQSVC